MKCMNASSSKEKYTWLKTPQDFEIRTLLCGEIKSLSEVETIFITYIYNNKCITDFKQKLSLLHQ